MGLLFDQYLGQGLSKWSPHAIFTLHGAGFDRRVDSLDLLNPYSIGKVLQT